MAKKQIKNEAKAGHKPVAVTSKLPVIDVDTKEFLKAHLTPSDRMKVGYQYGLLEETIRKMINGERGIYPAILADLKKIANNNSKRK